MSESRTIKATFEGGASEQVKVSPLKVAQFPSAFEAFEKEDELRLVELSTGMHPGWAKTLTVDSYTEIVTAVYEVNGSGFFGYAGRRAMFRSTRNVTPGQLRGESIGSTTPPKWKRSLQRVTLRRQLLSATATH